MAKSKKPNPWPASKVEERALSDLKPYDKNARTHSAAQVDQIAASIRQWGWTNPVLVTPAGMIIAGHGRVLAAQKLGLGRVPVMIAEGWSEAQIRAYVIADNKLALNAGWDTDILAAELKALDALDFDLGLTGFEGDELADLLIDGTEGLQDPDSVPAVQADPVTALGDTWLLGDHRLRCGDSTSADDVSALLGKAQPLLMVTDPPYGVEYDPSWRKEAGLASDGIAIGKVQNDDRADWREAWALFPGRVAYVWHGALHAQEVAASLEATGFKPRAQIVWVKTRAAISRGHYHWQHEPALYAEKDEEKPEDAGEIGFFIEQELSAYWYRPGGSANWRGGRKQSTVWFIEHLKSDTGHGTQKPVECMRRPILNNSTPGQSIYEPFCGSGTTLIACEMEGRQCLAMELDANYCDVIVRRWEAFTGKSATLEATGESFSDLAAKRKGGD